MQLPSHELLVFAVLTTLFISPVARATQADDTTVTIAAQNAGPTPFISQLTLEASQTDVLKAIQFTITPKEGSVTRPLSGTYSNGYLTERGYLDSATGEIFLAVWGLYAGFANTVKLTYYFNDGSSKMDSTTVTTETFHDPCGYTSPTVLLERTDTTLLSYDYMLVKGACSDFSPTVLDTDGALRWAGNAGVSNYSSAFFDNAFYLVGDDSFMRLEFDGTIATLALSADYGVTHIHHNIDPGKVGLILDVDTAEQLESVNIEVNAAGEEVKRWDLSQIISDAMTAGGDDPSQFVYPAPTDWFHNNAVAYNKADDSLIVSSREDFLICIDYETGAIKWILGDPTKKWYQFDSLRQYALTLADGSLPPIGQHAPSITFDQGLLCFDNGENSEFQIPPGQQRNYAAPRKYQIDTTTMTATEVWNYPQEESVSSGFCGSVYEDAPYNYLIDYALAEGPNATFFAQLLGLDASGAKAFYYQYATDRCDTAFNSIPLHLEVARFPTIGPRPLNLSTRGLVGMDEASLIGGFIISGSEAQTVVLRAIGPSLAASGLANAVADPTFNLYDATGTLIATNDDWESDPGAQQITANGLAPTDPAEAATLQTLEPGAYTFVVTQKDVTPGIGLVETYDLSPLAPSRLANLSTRASVGTGDEVLIGGFIVGEVGSNTVAIRAIGPSLGAAGVSNPLSNPLLTVYDGNGVALGGNDDWQEDISAPQLQQRGLAPSDPAESATILSLTPGAFTTIVSGANGEIGVGLLEIFDL